MAAAICWIQPCKGAGVCNLLDQALHWGGGLRVVESGSAIGLGCAICCIQPCNGAGVYNLLDPALRWGWVYKLRNPTLAEVYNLQDPARRWGCGPQIAESGLAMGPIREHQMALMTT